MAPIIPLKTQVHLRHGDTSVLEDEFKCDKGKEDGGPFQYPHEESYSIQSEQKCSRNLSPTVHLNEQSGIKENSEITFRYSKITTGYASGYFEDYTSSELIWRGEVMIGGQWKFVQVKDFSTFGKWDKRDEIIVFDMDKGGLDKKTKVRMEYTGNKARPWMVRYFSGHSLVQVDFASSDQKRLKAILDPVKTAYLSALEAAGLTK